MNDMNIQCSEFAELEGTAKYPTTEDGLGDLEELK